MSVDFEHFFEWAVGASKKFHIRDGEELEVHVFWREVPDGPKSARKDRATNARRPK